MTQELRNLELLHQFLATTVLKSTFKLLGQFSHPVETSFPIPSLRSGDEFFNWLEKRMGQTAKCVLINFSGVVAGTAGMILPLEIVTDFSKLLMGSLPESNIDEWLNDATLELGNIILNHTVGTVANAVTGKVTSDVVQLFESAGPELREVLKPNSSEEVILVQVIFKIPTLSVHGIIFISFLRKSSGLLLDHLNSISLSSSI